MKAMFDDEEVMEAVSYNNFSNDIFSDIVTSCYFEKE